MRPFEGIRVLDLTHVLAGPFCTYQLATLGADVIKIEGPHRPDMTREETVVPGLDDELYGTYFLAQNSGKRGITLDLRTRSGGEVLNRLIKTADVLVQNFAGNALENLGFGYAAASKLNPRLIYCSMTGFGRTGPKANHPAYDVVIQAYSGLMASNGSKGGQPTRVGPPMVDYGTGAQAALAISSALFQREKTGKGQRIDVSMLDAALMLMSSHVTDTLATGRAPGPHGNVHPKNAGYRTYETRDGTVMIGAWTNRQLSRLLNALGETKRAGEVLQTSRKDIGKTIDADTELIAKHIRQKTADEWEMILNEAHVPASRVRTIDEAVASEQVAARGVLQPLGQRDLEGVPEQLPVSAFIYEHGTPGIDRPPPTLGEHTDEILAELEFSPAEIAAMRESGVV